MINEITNYRCKCNKCNHLWTTKTFDVPSKCPKCKRVTWNEGSDPAPRFNAQRSAQIAQPSQPIQAEPKDALTAFIEKAQAKKGIAPESITIEAEPVDEWAGWGKEEQTYDDQTGEMRTFRRHIKSGRVKWLDAETWFG